MPSPKHITPGSRTEETAASEVHSVQELVRGIEDHALAVPGEGVWGSGQGY